MCPVGISGFSLMWVFRCLVIWLWFLFLWDWYNTDFGWFGFGVCWMVGLGLDSLLLTIRWWFAWVLLVAWWGGVSWCFVSVGWYNMDY